MLRSIKGLVGKFRSINARYHTPRIAMSPLVRAALMVLRVYLLLLVLLMVYKFATVVAA